MNAIVKRLERFNSAIPEFCTSHWLLRIPLALLFIQMGLMKLPIDPAEADSYGLSVLVWCCLLYTSPSPRDRTRSRMPSSA